MSHWNYRVMRCAYPPSPGCPGETIHRFAVHEVYYDDDGAIRAWTKESIEPYGETLEELVDDHKRVALAFEKPVLDLDQMNKDFEMRRNEAGR